MTTVQNIELISDLLYYYKRKLCTEWVTELYNY